MVCHMKDYEFLLLNIGKKRHHNELINDQLDDTI